EGESKDLHLPFSLSTHLDSGCPVQAPLGRDTTVLIHALSTSHENGCPILNAHAFRVGYHGPSSTLARCGDVKDSIAQIPSHHLP
ncbi:MAG TPA: hypothetical protein VGG45_14260, partial [Terracidiphilus sp.]